MRPSARRSRVRNQAFDRQWGTETSRMVSLGALELDRDLARHGKRYQASDSNQLREILRRLEISLSDYRFIDFGAGKGRIVLSAALLPFREVYGVEFSPELVRLAEKNLEIFGRRATKMAPIKMICCNAAVFDPPPGNLVCYFYNPFDEVIMRAVIAKLESALDDAARDIHVIYVDPQCGHLFEHSGRWLRSMHEGVLILSARNK